MPAPAIVAVALSQGKKELLKQMAKELGKKAVADAVVNRISSHSRNLQAQVEPKPLKVTPQVEGKGFDARRLIDERKRQNRELAGKKDENNNLTTSDDDLVNKSIENAKKIQENLKSKNQAIPNLMPNLSSSLQEETEVEENTTDEGITEEEGGRRENPVTGTAKTAMKVSLILTPLKFLIPVFLLLGLIFLIIDIGDKGIREVPVIGGGYAFIQDNILNKPDDQDDKTLRPNVAYKMNQDEADDMSEWLNMVRDITSGTGMYAQMADVDPSMLSNTGVGNNLGSGVTINPDGTKSHGFTFARALGGGSSSGSGGSWGNSGDPGGGGALSGKDGNTNLIWNSLTPEQQEAIRQKNGGNALAMAAIMTAYQGKGGMCQQWVRIVAQEAGMTMQQLFGVSSASTATNAWKSARSHGTGKTLSEIGGEGGLRPGDIIYGGGSGSAGHVGIVIADENGNMVIKDRQADAVRTSTLAKWSSWQKGGVYGVVRP